MSRSIRLLFSLGLLFHCVASQAQTDPAFYQILASQSDINDGGTLPGIVPSCIAATSIGQATSFFFYDRTSNAIVSHDPGLPFGQRTEVVAGASTLEAAAGSAITRCIDAATLRSQAGWFFVLEGLDGISRVLRLDLDGTVRLLTDPDSAIDQGDGITGITLASEFPAIGSLILARNTREGAPFDGVSRLGVFESDEQLVTVLSDDRLDLVDITSKGIRDAWVSSRNGEPPFHNVVGIVTSVLEEESFLGVYNSPCSDTPPAFPDCSAGLGDVILVGEEDDGLYFARSLVMNETVADTDGVQLGSGVARGLGLGRRIAFSEEELVTQTGIQGFSLAGISGYLDWTFASSGNAEPVFLVAGSDEGGATPGIYIISSTPFTASGASPPTATLDVTAAPNPVRSQFDISYQVATPLRVRSVLVDATGRTVRSIYDGVAYPGMARTVDCRHLAPGVYFVQTTTANEVHVESVVVL